MSVINTSHFQLCRRKVHFNFQVATPPNAIGGVHVYDSLLNVSQEGAGFNTQLGIAKSLSEV